MLTVWGRRDSSNVQAVMWGVGELGLPYERHDVGHRFGGNDTPEFLRMNPTGLVPVVRDGEDPPLWESTAILRSLAGRHGAAPFWPAEGAARARVDQWMVWSKLSVAGGFTEPVFWRVVRTPARERDPAAIARAVQALGRHLDVAEAQLARHPFLAGGDLTLADIVFGHVLHRYFAIDVARPEHPRVREYYDRLAGRPAYREHVMVSFDALRAE